MQDFIFFFRSFAVWISVRNTAGFLGILPPPPFPHSLPYNRTDFGQYISARNFSGCPFRSPKKKVKKWPQLNFFYFLGFVFVYY